MARFWKPQKGMKTVMKFHFITIILNTLPFIIDPQSNIFYFDSKTTADVETNDFFLLKVNIY